MNRRNVLKSLATLAGGVSAGFRLPLAHAEDYSGKLFVFVQADGGWDPTCFCDPKTNTSGEPVITHWSEREDVRQAGNVPYAPFANNAAFFDKYYDRMLVINGVDAQTNSHTVGVTHNWSGRNSEGFPTTTALLAAEYGAALPAPYLSFGGFSRTARVTRYTRLDNPDLLRNVATPEATPSDSRYVSEEDWEALRSYAADTARRLVAAPNLMPGAVYRSALYRSAIADEGLKRLADAIPPEDELEPNEDSGAIPGSGNEYGSDLRRQAQLAVLGFETGVSVSADLFIGGFDTHEVHDPDAGWLLGNLTDSVDYLWDYAESRGVADRVVVVIGSDFARTNYYNSQGGKDHWPIGSFVVMEKYQTWTNRVVDGTDALQFAQKINPTTLQRDEVGGTIIYPKHVHKALRRYLGIESSAGAVRYPFNNVEDFAFFESPAESDG